MSEEERKGKLGLPFTLRVVLPGGRVLSSGGTEEPSFEHPRSEFQMGQPGRWDSTRADVYLGCWRSLSL